VFAVIVMKSKQLGDLQLISFTHYIGVES